MVNSVFFDTNIVLAIIDTNRDRHEVALEVWESLVADSADIFISEDMLSTIFYLNEDKRFALEFFQSIQTRWQIVAFGEKVIKDAVNLTLGNSLDLEDVELNPNKYKTLSSGKPKDLSAVIATFSIIVGCPA
jgi:predicted nucleic acid-binding protein